jgi:hypothetical protein
VPDYDTFYPVDSDSNENEGKGEEEDKRDLSAGPLAISQAERTIGLLAA